MPINSFENYPMSWKPDFNKTTGPKYLALVHLLEEDIKNGVLKPGTKLPPQRELADYLDVNLSTISRAFKLCEQKGLLSAAVGSGTFISSDAAAEPILLSEEKNTQMIEMGAIIPAVRNNDKVKQYMEKLLRKPDALNLFSYGVPEGTKRHREAGMTWFAKTGFHTDREHILLAAGGQNALMASLGAFFERGDKVGTDPLTYPGIKTAAKLLGIHLIPIQSQNYEMTEEGIRYAVQNENIKGLYIIPDYHNPTAYIMSLETRQVIANVAKETDLLVIEDSINSLLTEAPLPPVAAFAPEQTVCLASLSKTVSAGLRTAFIYVPDRYRQDLVASLYSINISTSPMLATVSAGLIEDGIADEIIAGRKQEIMERNCIVNEILRDIPIMGASTSPLRYIHLPDYFTGKSFEICAQQVGVQVYGAERFAVGNKPAPKAIRISVTTPPTTDQLAEGLKRIQKFLLQ